MALIIETKPVSIFQPDCNLEVGHDSAIELIADHFRRAMRTEEIGQGNRFAAIGTYGNDFPFIGLKCPDNTNRAVYQLNQPTDNRSITSNLDSGPKQHSGQEIMKIRLADLIRVAIDFQQTVCR